jgi:hypothetical protein
MSNRFLSQIFYVEKSGVVGITIGCIVGESGKSHPRHIGMIIDIIVLDNY